MKEITGENMKISGESIPSIIKVHIDYNDYRLSQDFESMAGVKKEILTVQVRKPGRQEWIQIHGDEAWRMLAGIIEVREERENYLVNPKLCEDLIGEYNPKYLVTCITKQNNPFLWPIKAPASDGRLDQWNRTALEIVNEYAGKWIRVISNIGLGGYEIFMPSNEFPPPMWPPEGFNSLLQKAFKGKIVDSLDHPLVKRLRGEI